MILKYLQKIVLLKNLNSKSSTSTKAKPLKSHLPYTNIISLTNPITFSMDSQRNTTFLNLTPIKLRWRTLIKSRDSLFIENLRDKQSTDRLITCWSIWLTLVVFAVFSLALGKLWLAGFQHFQPTIISYPSCTTKVKADKKRLS